VSGGLPFPASSITFGAARVFDGQLDANLGEVLLERFAQFGLRSTEIHSMLVSNPVGEARLVSSCFAISGFVIIALVTRIVSGHQRAALDSRVWHAVEQWTMCCFCQSHSSTLPYFYCINGWRWCDGDIHGADLRLFFQTYFYRHPDRRYDAGSVAPDVRLRPSEKRIVAPLFAHLFSAAAASSAMERRSSGKKQRRSARVYRHHTTAKPFDKVEVRQALN